MLKKILSFLGMMIVTSIVVGLFTYAIMRLENLAWGLFLSLTGGLVAGLAGGRTAGRIVILSGALVVGLIWGLLMSITLGVGVFACFIISLYIGDWFIKRNPLIWAYFRVYLKGIWTYVIVFIFGYLLIIFLFANIYGTVYQLFAPEISLFAGKAFPKNPSFWDFFYFSARTSMTLGSDDISPAHLSTKILVCLEALIGITWSIVIFGFAISHSRYPKYDETDKKRDLISRYTLIEP